MKGGDRSVVQPRGRVAALAQQLCQLQRGIACIPRECALACGYMPQNGVMKCDGRF